MDLPPDLLLIHQPVRLRIMGLLYRHRDVRFSAARDALGLTDGNLASHAQRLEDAGLLVGRRVLTRDGFEMRYRITPEGSAAFQRYVEGLRAYLEALDGAAPPAPAAVDGPGDPPHRATRA